MKDKERENTALHMAVLWGNNESYRYLKGARARARGGAERRAGGLPGAPRGTGHPPPVTCLLPPAASLLTRGLFSLHTALGADEKVVNTDNLTPLQLAAQKGMKCTQQPVTSKDISAVPGNAPETPESQSMFCFILELNSSVRWTFGNVVRRERQRSAEA